MHAIRQCFSSDLKTHVVAVQSEQLEQAQEAATSKATDAAETIADLQEKLAALSSELGKAVQRSQQHVSKLHLIKQVQVRHVFCPAIERCEQLHVTSKYNLIATGSCCFHSNYSN